MWTQQLRAYFGGDAQNIDALLREIMPKLREIAIRELHRERYQAKNLDLTLGVSQRA